MHPQQSGSITTAASRKLNKLFVQQLVGVAYPLCSCSIFFFRCDAHDFAYYCIIILDDIYDYYERCYNYRILVC